MAEPALPPGTKLGRFRIVEFLAGGGMGRVYRARDERLDRDVAVKVLPPDIESDPAARARLLREARSAAALNHPHICVVHEVEVDGGRDFIAMEWVDGRPLDQVVRAGRLSESEVTRIGAEIADAIAHAHGRGVIHRDLKSANVMLSSDGWAKVLDFGLARRVATPDSSTLDGQGLSLTQQGSVVGTTHYMAPELLRGADADARSDIWAFGVVLYEMTSGRLPFDGATRAVVEGAILHSEPAPLPEVVPQGLRAIIGRCLEKDPARRFDSVSEVRAKLQMTTSSGDLPRVASSAPAAAAAVTSPGGWIRLVTRPRILGAALLGGIVLAAGLASLDPGIREWLWRPFRPAGPAPIPALAVLPLEIASRDPAQAYIAAGMTDAISNQLTRIAGLRVIAQGSAAGLVRQGKSPDEIGRKLGVSTLLQGSVASDSERVRLSLQLLDARTGHKSWAQDYDRSARDVLSVEKEVARAIAMRLHVPLAPDPRPAPPIDPEAYRAYLRGKAELAKGAMLETEQEAERQFRHALELSPDYAPAWAGIANSSYAMSSLFLAPNIAIPRARAAAEKALALDPDLAEAHTVYGITKMVYDWDWVAAEKEFDRAIALQPGDGVAYSWRGQLQLRRGRFDEGIAFMRHASDLDPLAGGASLGWPLEEARRYDEAIRQLRALVTTDPDDHGWYVALGLAMLENGDPAGGVASIEKGVTMYAENDDLWQLAYAYGKAGRKADAERVIARLLERRGQMFVPAMSLANAYAGVGDAENAFHWLDLAFEDHSEMLIALKIGRQWDRLRSDPRYDQALRRLRLLS